MRRIKLLNIFELYVSGIFGKLFLQRADKSVHKLLNKKEILARRVTRNTTKEILPSERYHKETEKNLYNDSSDGLTIFWQFFDEKFYFPLLFWKSKFTRYVFYMR